jgi:hypothetical protein
MGRRCGFFGTADLYASDNQPPSGKNDPYRAREGMKRVKYVFSMRWRLASGSVLFSSVVGLSITACAPPSPRAPHPPDPVFRVERLGPILTPETHPAAGANIQGPSLVRVPDWVDRPLGRYYLYFADHKGDRIGLAYADSLSGPWTVHEPGALRIEDSHFAVTPPEVRWLALQLVRVAAWWRGIELTHGLERELSMPHVASPDVHVDEANRRFVLYFHGLDEFARQATRAATSPDGLHFEAHPEILGETYFRAFWHDGRPHALAMPGRLYRSTDPISGFEAGPLLFEPDMRHSALLRRGDTLHVFWSRVGDAPEVLLRSTIDLGGPWESWQESAPVEVLRPERDWEGANAPVEPSVRSAVYGRVNQLRDPAIFEEAGRVYLLYAIAGESGIALAELHSREGDGADRRRPRQAGYLTSE